MSTESIARELIDAFNAGDLGRMRALLSEDLHAFITNRDGGVDEVVGPDDYLGRIEAMDLPSAAFGVSITQLVRVREDMVMVMVEVHAARGGRKLRNHATHLLLLREHRVAEWWMVEALPAESDAFWAS